MKKALLVSAISFGGFAVANLIVYLVLVGVGIKSLSALMFLFLGASILCAWIPFFLNLIFKFDIPKVVDIPYQIFLVVALIFGSAWGFYGLWAPLDSVVHFLSGVMIALFSYSFFKQSKTSKLSFFWLFVLCFSFTMMCGAVWEIWEFSVDSLIGHNGQQWMGKVGQEALFDTMKDIICDCVGGLIGATVAVLIERKEQKKQQDNQQTDAKEALLQ